MLFITCLLAGITLKLADVYGEGDHNIRQYVFAIVSALSFGALLSYDSVSSSIFLGIIGGVLLSRKINRSNLFFGLILALVIAWIGGFQAPIVWLLIIVMVFSFLDETCHDRFADKKDRFTLFFSVRPLLKIAMLLLTVLALIDVIYVIGFFSFDCSYDLTSWLLRIHDVEKA